MQFLELFICMLLNCLISDLKNPPFNISKFTYKAKNKHDGIVDFNPGNVIRVSWKFDVLSLREEAISF